MINPVIVDQINNVEKGRRARQVAEVQLINQAYDQPRQFPNLLTIAKTFISKFVWHYPEQLPEQIASGEIELVEDC